MGLTVEPFKSINENFKIKTINLKHQESNVVRDNFS